MPVYSKKGCFSCKRRRKKCGEEKPKCLQCLRLGLTCLYGTTASATPLTKAARNDGWVLMPRHALRAIISTGPEAAHVGDFHSLQVKDSRKPEIVDQVSFMLGMMMETSWPYRPTSHSLFRVSGGWVDPTFNNLSMTLSVTAIAGGIRDVNTPDPRWTDIRLRYESETIQRVRHGIDSTSSQAPDVNEYELLISAAHLVWIRENYNCDGEALRRLANGARALTERAGGLERFLANGNHHEVHIIIKAEWIASLVNMDEPAYLTEYPRPLLSLSLTMPVSLISIRIRLSPHVSPEVVALALDLRLLMHYRISPEQANHCSSLVEYWQLTSLQNYCDLQLCAAQRRHANSRTISECVTYALIALRLDVIGDKVLHNQIGRLIRQRLHLSLVLFDRNYCSNSDAREIIIWLLILHLVLNEQSENSRDLLTRLVVCLEDNFDAVRASWPSGWQTMVRDILGSILWHGRLDKMLVEILGSI